MATADHMEMHFEHKQLLNELALWQEQLGLWRQEFREALAEIDRLKISLKSHDEALQKHADDLDRECTRLQDHEHALADYERGGSGQELIALAKNHTKELSSQLNRRAVHERIKRHHHSVMAQWRLLFDALTKSM
jgi:hypothetical protein